MKSVFLKDLSDIESKGRLEFVSFRGRIERGGIWRYLHRLGGGALEKVCKLRETSPSLKPPPISNCFSVITACLRLNIHFTLMPTSHMYKLSTHP